MSGKRDAAVPIGQLERHGQRVCMDGDRASVARRLRAGATIGIGAMTGHGSHAFP
jgi:hypothetical protein